MALVYSHIMNRMRRWRQKKKFGQSGLLNQVCVWAPERSEELVRSICERVAEPTERGESLRGLLVRQLNRLRTVLESWHGATLRLEIDGPLVGPWWYMKPMGGRIIGNSDRTHVELTPHEAEDIQRRMRACWERELAAWLDSHNLRDEVRDDTGVVVGSDMYLPKASKRRPADEAAFAANEARIANTVRDEAIAHRTPPVEYRSILEYEGRDCYPSFCQLVHRCIDVRIQIALIHAEFGGTNPTNMFEDLATHVRQKLYPAVAADKIEWYDVVPNGHYNHHEFCGARDGISINAVSMKHANGIYSSPTWAKFDGTTAPDWIALIEGVITRTHISRSYSERGESAERAKTADNVLVQ